ncbi:hypothetical protein ACFQER_01195 [Halomicroarcula sp. GCM10025894]
MIRCAYRGDTKIEWDSQGGSYRYSLDPDRPSWQELDAEDVSVPSWASEHFKGDVAELKERAMAQESSREVDATTEERLKDLGYM